MENVRHGVPGRDGYYLEQRFLKSVGIIQNVVFLNRVSLGNTGLKRFLIAELHAFNLPICLRNIQDWDIVCHVPQGYLTT